MFTFVPNKAYLRGILLHYFIQNKSAAEAHRIRVETYGGEMWIHYDNPKRRKSWAMRQTKYPWFEASFLVC